MRAAPIALALVVLAATPALAQLSQGRPPGWIADSKTGCRVWNYQPEGQETISWSGPCVGGVAEGHGLLHWFSSGQSNGAFEGDMKAGRPEGRGIQTYGSGDRVEGEFHDGRVEGKGAYVFANGDRYIGDFRKGEFEGYGVLTLDNGAGRYEGEWHGGRAHGRGTYKTAKNTYKGIWKNGCFKDPDDPMSGAAVMATLKECGLE